VGRSARSRVINRGAYMPGPGEGRLATVGRPCLGNLALWPWFPSPALNSRLGSPLSQVLHSLASSFAYNCPPLPVSTAPLGRHCFPVPLLQIEKLSAELKGCAMGRQPGLPWCWDTQPMSLPNPLRHALREGLSISRRSGAPLLSPASRAVRTPRLLQPWG